MERKRAPGRWPLVLAAAAVCAALVFLLGTTVPSADDFWYSTFLDGGLRRWFALLKEHYETFNGRTLVHAAAQLVLHFGSWLFSLVGTAVCILLPWAAAAAERRPRRELLPALLLFGTGLLALPREVLVEGVLWTSAFFNYVLPTAMICGMILLLSRVCARPGVKPGALLACALTGFLCGATTEQSGLVAAAAALFYVLLCLLENRAALPCPIAAAAAAAAGVGSIFLSPATRLRLAQETGGSGLFAALEEGLKQEAALFASSRAMALLLALVFASAVLALWCAGKRRRVLLPAVLLSGAAAAAPSLVPPDWAVWFYGLDLLLLLGWGLALVLIRRREAGLLLLAAAGALCVMLPTQSIYPRTLLPALLFGLAAVAVLLPEALLRLPPTLGSGLPSLAAAAVLAVHLPLFSGSLFNCRLDLANCAAAREAQESGVLWYSVDYDLEYTHSKPFHNGFFYTSYLESQGLDPDAVTVYFSSESLPAIYAGETRLTSPALPDGTGDWLLPLRDIVEHFGGSISLSGSDMTIFLDDRPYTLETLSDREVRLSWTDSSGTARSCSFPRAAEWFETMLGRALYTEVLGFTVSVSPDGGEITVTR